MSEERAHAPHCDPSILHAPGKCDACDQYPDWQQMRDVQQINFTGSHDTGKAPCPSVYFRRASDRDQWSGNLPWKGRP